MTPVSSQTKGATSDDQDGYHGYWPKNLYEVSQVWGGRDKLTRLIEILHKEGLLIMMDVTPNHMGYFAGSMVSRLHPFNKLEYYHNCDGCCGDCTISCGFFAYDNETWPAFQARQARILEKCQLLGLPDLDQSVPFVKEELLRWLTWLVSTFNVDGLRIDAARHMSNPFLIALRDALPNTMTAAEYPYGAAMANWAGLLNATKQVAARLSAGALDTSFSFVMQSAMQWVFAQKPNYPISLRPWPMSHLHTLVELHRRLMPRQAGLLLLFLDSPDSSRFIELNPNLNIYASAMTFIMFTEGIPLVYYGTEQGMHAQRGALWELGYDTTHPRYMLLRTLIKHRQALEVWNYRVEALVVNNFSYIFARGAAVVSLTNYLNCPYELRWTFPSEELVTLPPRFRNKTLTDLVAGQHTLLVPPDGVVSIPLAYNNAPRVYVERVLPPDPPFVSAFTAEYDSAYGVEEERAAAQQAAAYWGLMAAALAAPLLLLLAVWLAGRRGDWGGREAGPAKGGVWAPRCMSVQGLRAWGMRWCWGVGTWWRCGKRPSHVAGCGKEDKQQGAGGFPAAVEERDQGGKLIKDCEPTLVPEPWDAVKTSQLDQRTQHGTPRHNAGPGQVEDWRQDAECTQDREPGGGSQPVGDVQPPAPCLDAQGPGGIALAGDPWGVPAGGTAAVPPSTDTVRDYLQAEHDTATPPLPAPAVASLAPGLSERAVMHVAMEYSIPHLGLEKEFIFGGLGKVVDTFIRHWPGPRAVCAPAYRAAYSSPSATAPALAGGPAVLSFSALVGGSPLPVQVFSVRDPCDPHGLTFFLIQADVFRQRERNQIYSFVSEHEMLTWLAVFNQAVARVISHFAVRRVQFHDYHGALCQQYLPSSTVRPHVLYVAHNAHYNGTFPLHCNARRHYVYNMLNLRAEKYRWLEHKGQVDMTHSMATYMLQRQAGHGVVAVSARYAQQMSHTLSQFWALGPDKVVGVPNALPVEHTLAAATQLSQQQRLALKQRAKQEYQRRAGLQEGKEFTLLVFMGRFTQQKGVDLLAKVAPGLMRSQPQVQLVAVGPLGDAVGARAAAQLAQLAHAWPGRVRAAGDYYVEGEEKELLLLAADWCLCPSRFEPFGLVDVEFGWNGALIVGHDTGGLSKMPGVYFQADGASVAHLAARFDEALSSALALSELQRHDMMQEAFERRFPIAEQMAAYEGVWRDVEAVGGEDTRWTIQIRKHAHSGGTYSGRQLQQQRSVSPELVLQDKDVAHVSLTRDKDSSDGQAGKELAGPLRWWRWRPRSAPREAQEQLQYFAQRWQNIMDGKLVLTVRPRHLLSQYYLIVLQAGTLLPSLLLLSYSLYVSIANSVDRTCPVTDDSTAVLPELSSMGARVLSYLLLCTAAAPMWMALALHVQPLTYVKVVALVQASSMLLSTTALQFSVILNPALLAVSLAALSGAPLLPVSFLGLESDSLADLGTAPMSLGEGVRFCMLAGLALLSGLSSSALPLLVVGGAAAVISTAAAAWFCTTGALPDEYRFLSLSLKGQAQLAAPLLGLWARPPPGNAGPRQGVGEQDGGSEGGDGTGSAITATTSLTVQEQVQDDGHVAGRSGVLSATEEAELEGQMDQEHANKAAGVKEGPVKEAAGEALAGKAAVGKEAAVGNEGTGTASTPPLPPSPPQQQRQSWGQLWWGQWWLQLQRLGTVMCSVRAVEAFRRAVCSMKKRAETAGSWRVRAQDSVLHAVRAMGTVAVPQLHVWVLGLCQSALDMAGLSLLGMLVLQVSPLVAFALFNASMFGGCMAASVAVTLLLRTRLALRRLDRALVAAAGLPGLYLVLALLVLSLGPHYDADPGLATTLLVLTAVVSAVLGARGGVVGYLVVCSLPSRELVALWQVAAVLVSGVVMLGMVLIAYTWTTAMSWGALVAACAVIEALRLMLAVATAHTFPHENLITV